jgi:hypothetical protein
MEIVEGALGSPWESAWKRWVKDLLNRTICVIIPLKTQGFQMVVWEKNNFAELSTGHAGLLLEIRSSL